MSHANPFFVDRYNGRDTFVVDSAGRLMLMRHFSADQCRRALKVRGLQKVVRRALQGRLRMLAGRKS